MIKITWHGHSCFTLSSELYDIVLDPYEPESVPGLEPLELLADDVYCSHYHGDHGCEWIVDIREEHEDDPFKVTEIRSFHDPEGGKLRGENVIRIFNAKGVKVAHLGDIGCELTKEQKEKLTGLDAIMVPVGGFFTIGPKEAKKLMDELKPNVVIPMHYRGEGFGYDVIGTLDEYTKLCDNVVEYDTNEIEIKKNMPARTAVLKLIQ